MQKILDYVSTPLSLVLAASVSILATSAHAYKAVWDVSHHNGLPVAADCSDCEEDLGIIIACTGRGLPAEVTVNGAAARSGQDGAPASVSFNIDGQIFTKQAKTVEFGLIGFTPTFNLEPNDPLIEALQAGEAASVTFNNETSQLRLRGSRTALDVFKQGCGWLEVQNTQPEQPGEQPPAGQSTVFGVSPGEAYTQPNQDGLLWYTSSYDVGTANASYELRYAIPETDAVAIVASCNAANPSVYKTRMMINFGEASHNQMVEVAISFDDQTRMIRQGFVFVESEESAGVEVLLDQRDEFWLKLASAKSVSIGVEGQTAITLPSAAQAGAHFVSKCK